MRIALDFDGTYTLDPDFWNAFIVNALANGHDVFMVTFRNDLFDTSSELRWIGHTLKIKVYFTRGVAKRWWCLHHGPGEVDVWIDDTPEAILENSPMTPADIQRWRDNQKDFAD